MTFPFATHTEIVAVPSTFHLKPELFSTSAVCRQLPTRHPPCTLSAGASHLDWTYADTSKVSIQRSYTPLSLCWTRRARIHQQRGIFCSSPFRTPFICHPVLVCACGSPLHQSLGLVNIQARNVNMSERQSTNGSHKLKMSYILNENDSRSTRHDPMDIDTPSSSSRRHEASQADEKERKYPCTQCLLRFLSKGDQQKHINTVHLRIKKHVCAICGAKFGEKGNLTKHEKRKHEQVREFQCSVCQKAFVLRDGLVRHEKTVHRMKSSSSSSSRHAAGSSSTERHSYKPSAASNRSRKQWLFSSWLRESHILKGPVILNDEHLNAVVHGFFSSLLCRYGRLLRTTHTSRTSHPIGTENSDFSSMIVPLAMGSHTLKLGPLKLTYEHFNAILHRFCFLCSVDMEDYMED